MKFRRQPVEEVSVNLTPLIDVVFLLLIFFMVSTTFSHETRLQMNLPQASAARAVKESREITIEINAAGNYAIAEEILPGTSVELVKATLAKVANDDVTRPLIISADAKTPHAAVVVALEAAGALGFKKLSIATRAPETSSNDDLP